MIVKSALAKIASVFYVDARNKGRIGWSDVKNISQLVWSGQN